MMQSKITSFLAGRRFAVVGASIDRAKYGSKVLRAYQQNNLDVFPVNPNADETERQRAYPSLESLPDSVDGVSIVTLSGKTEQVVLQAVELGVRNIWIQPGAENEESGDCAERSGANLFAGGPRVLIALGYREEEQESVEV